MQVGSLADYRDLAGTAHALEHLCFMGSDKFPGEEEWASWLADNGGMSNAYTASTQTNYHYQVRATSLRASLERWSRFFVAPLLHEGAWARELKNIDSEHSKNISNDMWREMQLDRSTSDPEHAVCAFATGNKATLHDIPVAAGVDVRAKLLEFHRRHYTSSRMTVALLGKEDVDTLMAWAREFFADVRDEGDAQPVYGSDPYKGRTGLVQTMVPLKETRTITLQWAIPPQQSHFLSRPSGLASHLLGHEGPGSVLEALKARGWATELSAGNFADEADFATFVVQIRLTAEGLAHTDDVAACVFEYIRIMQEEGAEKQKWVFEEVAAVGASSFRFKGRSNPLSYVTGLSSGLTYLPGRFAVSKGSLARVWDPAAYAAVLDSFTPERVRVRIAAQDEHIVAQCDKAEPVYGTQYGERAATPEQMALWKGEAGTGRAFPDLALPEPNPFLATDFDLRSGLEPGRTVDTRLRAEREAEPAADLGTADSILLEAARGQPACGRRVMPSPTLLDESSEGQLFWRCDDWFGEPKTVVQVQYKQPCASASAEQSLLTSLLGLALTDDLGSMSYAASVAGLHYGIGDTTSGLTLAVSGFSHKAGVLLSRVTDALAAAAAAGSDSDPAAAAAAPTVLSEQAVGRQSRRRTETYVNNDLSPLYHLGMIEAGYACSDGQHHYKAKLEILRAWQAEDGDDHPRLLRARLLAHARSLFRTCSARILVFGNASEAEAREMAAAVRSPLRAAKAEPPSPADLALPAMSPRCILPPAGTNARIVVPCRNPNDSNGAINVRLFLGPDTVATSALTAIIGGLAAQPAFTQLRTKEALGYIVFAGSFREANAVGLRVIVQSASMSARQLEDRCESFLWGFRATLASMTEERFVENRDAAVAKRREALSSVTSAASKVWFEVSDGTMRFSRAAEEVRAISKLTLAQVREVFDRAFAPGAPQRRRLAIIMTEGESSADAGAAAGDEGADDAAAGAEAGAEAPPPAPECTTLTGAAAVEHLTAASEADITGWPSASSLEPLAVDADVPAPPAIVVAELDPAMLKAACGRVPAVGQAAFAAWQAEQAAAKA